jgi:hypothetical protein
VSTKLCEFRVLIDLVLGALQDVLLRRISHPDEWLRSPFSGKTAMLVFQLRKVGVPWVSHRTAVICTVRHINAWRSRIITDADSAASASSAACRHRHSPGPGSAPRWSERIL